MVLAMGLIRPNLVTIVATALVAALLSAAPVAAQSDSQGDFSSGVRRDGDHYPASIDTTVPPGGYSTITTPSLPKDAKTLKVKLQVDADATQDEKEAFDQLATAFGKMTKQQRLLTCVNMYSFLVTAPQSGNDVGTEVQFNVDAANLALVVLAGCVRLAGLVTSTPPADGTADSGSASRAKMRACVQDKLGAPGTLDQADDGSWTLSVDGAITEARNKLKVGCRTTSGKTVLMVRAAKAGVPLRKVLGKTARLSLVSTADAESGAPTKVTFSLP